MDKNLSIFNSNKKTKILSVIFQKNQLESLLGSIFFDCFYDIISNKNNFNLLKIIKTKWQNITWIINMDIQKYFSVINREFLLLKLQKCCDQKTFNLICKFLKNGYIGSHNYFNILKKFETSMFQGSLISTLLFNLYLHFFDCFLINNFMLD